MKKRISSREDHSGSSKQLDGVIVAGNAQANGGRNSRERKRRKFDHAQVPGPTFATSAVRAIMPRQQMQFQNGCWVPPVVAVARFYGLSHLQGRKSKVSMESIRALRSDDEPEEFCEIFEDAFGVWPAKKSFSNDAEFMESAGEVKCCGPTSIVEHGVKSVSQPWFEELKKTIERDDAVILLVERQERKDRGKTHYLLVLGYEETIRRRTGKSYTVYVKDPTESDEMLTAKFWDESTVELTTKQANGSILDRYMILEATHLSVVRGDEGTNEEGNESSPGARSAHPK